MNIFFLSMSIRRCAKAHFDKHVIKMILEYCQILSTCWHMVNSEEASRHLENGNIYKKTHIHHPCVKWIQLHYNNYDYVIKLALELCKEWRYRYQHHKVHGCELKLLFLYDHRPTLPANGGSAIPNDNIIKSSHNSKCLQLPLPQAMPMIEQLRKSIRDKTEQINELVIKLIKNEAEIKQLKNKIEAYQDLLGKIENNL